MWLRRLFWLVMAAMSLVLIEGQSVVYADYTQQQIYQMGIGYFDVNDDSSVAACSDDSLANNDAAQFIWSYFSNKGLSAIAVAGIMGNLHQENGAFDPARKQNDSLQAASKNPSVNGAAFGIVQWDGGRRVSVLQALDAAGLSKYYGANYGQPDIDASTIPQADSNKMLQTELDFAWSSDGTKISDLANQLNAATSVEGSDGSAEIFNSLYERSGDDASQVQQRVGDAKTFLSKYGSIGGCGSLGGVATVQDGVAWAEKFMSDTKNQYHPAVTNLNQQKDGNITSLYRITKDSGGNGNCWGGADCGQCTAVSGWFVSQMTNYTYGNGNGSEVVDNLAAHGVKTGSTPEPFSIFSTGSGDNHTGLVLGVLKDGTVITLENNWPGTAYPYGTLVIRQYDITHYYSSGVKFAYVGDKLTQGAEQ